MPMQGVKTMNEDLWGWVYWVGHTLSVGSILGALAGLFPAFASLVALIFYLFQIWENKTFQRWLHARRMKQVAKLRAKLMVLEAKDVADKKAINYEH